MMNLDQVTPSMITPRPPPLASPSGNHRAQRRLKRGIADYSRARPAAAGVNAATVGVSSIASLSSSIQSVERRVPSTPSSSFRQRSALSSLMASHSVPLDARLPPMQQQPLVASAGAGIGGGGGGGGALSNPMKGPHAAAVATPALEESAVEAAVRLGVVPSSGLSMSDRHALLRGGGGGSMAVDSPGRLSTPGRRTKETEVQLAEGWLDEVLQYGIQELGETHTELGAMTQALSDGESEVEAAQAMQSGKARFGVGREQLRQRGVSDAEADRLYRALYVYSVGFHEMVQHVVGTTPDRARAVADVLRAFNFVSGVIQRTSFTNTLVSSMLQNESKSAQIEDLQARLAKAEAALTDQGEELQMQERMYDDSIAEITHTDEEKRALKEQLAEAQQLVESVSMPGGEIHRLKLLLEEAMLAKHTVFEAGEMAKSALQGSLETEKQEHEALRQTFALWKKENEELVVQLRQQVEFEQMSSSKKIEHLSSELDKKRKTIPPLRDEIEELKKKLADQRTEAQRVEKGLKAVITELRREVEQVKQAADVQCRATEDAAKDALQGIQVAEAKIPPLQAKIAAQEKQLVEIKVERAKLRDAVEEVMRDIKTEKQKSHTVQGLLDESEQKVTLVTEELADVKASTAKTITALENDIAEAAETLDKSEKKAAMKLKQEKDKAAKIIKQKDDQVEQLNTDIRNLKQQIQQLRDAKEELRRTNEKTIAQLENNIRRLEADVEDRDKKIEERNSKINDLMKEIAGLKNEIKRLITSHKRDMQMAAEEHASEVTELVMKGNKVQKALNMKQADYEALQEVLTEEVNQGKLARESVHASLRAHDTDLSERERKLKEECADKISAQEKQIELISASLIKLDRSRHRVVTQRNELRRNLRQNARELLDARKETDYVRTHVEELKIEIGKLEQYLQRYRERFRSKDAGVQADTKGPIVEQVQALQALMEASRKGERAVGSTLEMMGLALQVVEVLEQACSMEKGSVSDFFRIAIDEYDLENDTVLQERNSAKERYNVARVEVKLGEQKIEELQQNILREEVENSKLTQNIIALKEEIERGPPELHTLQKEHAQQLEAKALLEKQQLTVLADVQAFGAQAAEMVREVELKAARDYQTLISQLVEPDVAERCRTMLTEVEESSSDRAGESADELVATATSILQRAAGDAEEGPQTGLMDKIEAASESLVSKTVELQAAVSNKDDLAGKVLALQGSKAEILEQHSIYLRSVSEGSDWLPQSSRALLGGQPAGQTHPAPPPEHFRAAEQWQHAVSLSDRITDVAAEPMPVRKLQSTIIGLYMEKVYAELIQGKQCCDLRDFVVRQFELRYGLGGVAERRLLSFVGGLRKHSDATLRIALFRQFVRLDGAGERSGAAVDRSSPEAQNFLLNVLHALHTYLGRGGDAGTTGAQWFNPSSTQTSLNASTVETGWTGTQYEDSGDDFGWATRWLLTSTGSVSDAAARAPNGEGGGNLCDTAEFEAAVALAARGEAPDATAAVAAAASTPATEPQPEPQPEPKPELNADGMPAQRQAEDDSDRARHSSAPVQATAQTMLRGVTVPIPIVQEVTKAVFAAETPHVLPTLLRYITTAQEGGGGLQSSSFASASGPWSTAGSALSGAAWANLCVSALLCNTRLVA
jgi:DNA repair exonuclease SbcCD ATPase subunit